MKDITENITEEFLGRVPILSNKFEMVTASQSATPAVLPTLDYDTEILYSLSWHTQVRGRSEHSGLIENVAGKKLFISALKHEMYGEARLELISALMLLHDGEVAEAMTVIGKLIEEMS